MGALLSPRIARVEDVMDVLTCEPQLRGDLEISFNPADGYSPGDSPFPSPPFQVSPDIEGETVCGPGEICLSTTSKLIRCLRPH